MQNEEDFTRTMRDFFAIATNRDLRIMATMQDFDTKVTEINTKLDAMKAQHGDLKTSVDKAIVDLGTAVASGHASVLDSIMATLTAFSDKLTTMGTEMTGMQTEITAAIAAVPPPAVAPAAK